VRIEIGDRTLIDTNNCVVYPDGTATHADSHGCQIPNDSDVDPVKRFRLALRADGTVTVIKIGNLASAAASFVLEKGEGPADIQFWGVAAFRTNFDFLEQYGITLTGSAVLQINATNSPHSETISLEGIPGGVMFA